MTEIKTTQKYLRISPRKLRVVVEMVKKLEPQQAVEVLSHVSKRAALPLQKAIKTAIANAKVKGIEGDLIFKEIQIGEGPILKRGKPVARGRWHPIAKRTSHIRIVLTTKEKKKNGTKN
jgi:large subunit ribosomal protein L22